MSTHNIRFLREIRKMSIFEQINLGVTSDFDQLLFLGQAIYLITQP